MYEVMPLPPFLKGDVIRRMTGGFSRSRLRNKKLSPKTALL